MSSAYLVMNAWREILARVFEGVEVQPNVSPDWLINPATRRRLKLDLLYPAVGIAVRFAGLTAKGQRRRSDWELLEDEQRDQTRIELCRLNGIQLSVIDPSDEPVKQMDRLLQVLSRARRVTAQNGRPAKEKAAAMDALATATAVANQLRGALSRKPDQMMATLAEAWRDREAGIATELQKAGASRKKAPSRSQQRKLAGLACGQRVDHVRFGAGVITDMSGDGTEQQITILFDADRERTFLASLLVGKLTAAT